MVRIKIKWVSNACRYRWPQAYSVTSLRWGRGKEKFCELKMRTAVNSRLGVRSDSFYGFSSSFLRFHLRYRISIRINKHISMESDFYVRLSVYWPGGGYLCAVLPNAWCVSCESISIHRKQQTYFQSSDACVMICIFHLLCATIGPRFATKCTAFSKLLNSKCFCCVRDVSDTWNVHTTISHFSPPFMKFITNSSVSSFQYQCAPFLSSFFFLYYQYCFNSNEFIAFFDGMNSRRFVVNNVK